MATTRFVALLAVDMLLMVRIRNENNNDTDMNIISEFVAVLSIFSSCRCCFPKIENGQDSTNRHSTSHRRQIQDTNCDHSPF
eukprot:scaffold59287_cov53-Attheya_sp.AAC.7